MHPTALGASLYDILTALKADVKLFPKLDVSYSAQQPLDVPVVVNLPENGLRLRFDGPDQRLRLIEILTFGKTRFTYKNEDLVPHQDVSSTVRSSPTPLLYRRVYQLFGPSYPGEYIPPRDGSSQGTYVLSFAGVALSFLLQPSTWSPKVDHATLLSSSASPVTSMAIYEGNSWPESRNKLFTQKPALPKSLNVPLRHKEGISDQIEEIKILGAGRVELLRRSSPSIFMTMSESTAQDLITDLGPPDTIYKRPEQIDDSPRKPTRPERRRSSSIVARNSYGNNSYGSTPSSVSSSNTDTYDADFEEDDGIDGPDVIRSQEQYYCYFQHGFDLLLGPPTDISEMPGQTNTKPADRGATSSSHTSAVTVTRMILHGNIPGSYSFNQHRRIRWTLDHVSKIDGGLITSKTSFDTIHPSLLSTFRDVWPEKDMKEGMVIVRDWGGDDSPSGSAVLIGGDMDDDEEEDGMSLNKDSEQWLKNTQLYKFPGLMFEVMHNGAVSALTVC